MQGTNLLQFLAQIPSLLWQLTKTRRQMGQSGQQFFHDGVTVTWQMELKQKPLSVCLQQAGCSSKSLSASISVFGRFCDFESLVLNYQSTQVPLCYNRFRTMKPPLKTFLTSHKLALPMSSKKDFSNIWYGDFSAIICKSECRA